MWQVLYRKGNGSWLYLIKVENIKKEFEKKINKNKKIKFLEDNDISFEVNNGEI